MVTRPRYRLMGVLVVALGLAGCSSSHKTTAPTAAPTRSTSAHPASSAPAGSAPASSSPAGSAPASSAQPSSSPAVIASPSSTSMAENLALTTAIRSQLVRAAAAMDNVPVSTFLGLAPATGYYGYDPASKTYWAAAALVPNPASSIGPVIVQDDGSYLLFHQSAGGSWIAQNDGLGGIEDAHCPAIPASIVAVWGWAPGACQPPA